MSEKEIKAGDFVEIVTTEEESIKGYLQPTIIEGAFCVRLSTGGLEFVEDELVDDIKESDLGLEAIGGQSDAGLRIVARG